MLLLVLLMIMLAEFEPVRLTFLRGAAVPGSDGGLHGGFLTEDGYPVPGGLHRG